MCDYTKYVWQKYYEGARRSLIHSPLLFICDYSDAEIHIGFSLAQYVAMNTKLLNATTFCDR